MQKYLDRTISMFNGGLAVSTSSILFKLRVVTTLSYGCQLCCPTKSVIDTEKKAGFKMLHVTHNVVPAGVPQLMNSAGGISLPSIEVLATAAQMRVATSPNISWRTTWKRLNATRVEFWSLRQSCQAYWRQTVEGRQALVKCGFR